MFSTLSLISCLLYINLTFSEEISNGDIFSNSSNAFSTFFNPFSKKLKINLKIILKKAKI